MDKFNERKIILVKRKSRLEELVARFNTLQQAKFYIEHLGADFSDYVSEDEKYRKAISEASNILGSIARLQVIDRTFLPTFIFGHDELVVAIGQDGLVANTIKYLDKQRLVGVNPDPARWDWVLLPFRVKDLKNIVADALRNKCRVKEVTMAKAILNDGQYIYRVNDLFIGQRTHVSARYQLKLGSVSEAQSSSGIIVSTGLGSTGWMKSVLSGAANMVKIITGEEISLGQEKKISWDDEKLYFLVREPFPSRTSKANLVFGAVTKETPLKILSQMPENGVIFSDGIENDFLNFNSGVEATITIAEKKGHLVV